MELKANRCYWTMSNKSDVKAVEVVTGKDRITRTVKERSEDQQDPDLAIGFIGIAVLVGVLLYYGNEENKKSGWHY